MQRGLAMEMLLRYAHARGLTHMDDMIYLRNALLQALGVDAPDADCGSEPMLELPPTATPMLEALCADAVTRGIVEDLPSARETFAAHLMNLLTPLPSQIARAYADMRTQKGAQAATDWFYELCRANDYIRVDQIARNVGFTAPSPYGELEITINLSKPEKDPREIARLKDAPSVGYPLCMLCIENEGYAGRTGYPTHETLRTLPITLDGESWRFQYSPYAYYPEHCIALNVRHIPMSISHRTFGLLLSFVDQFSHYFIGSNADLPIVGGSILNHDHFQGGRHVFPMDKAPIYAAFRHPQYKHVAIEAVRWPMTCLRLTSCDQEALIDLSEHLLAAWRTYDDPSHDILHASGDTPHNTITPIARKEADGRYTLQLVLRNNRTTNEHPLGIFHPHADLHHIKRENIGLIEVMGLFILPGRLLEELESLQGYLTGDAPMEKPADNSPLAQHYEWIASLAQAHGTALSQADARMVLREALAEKCTRVLEDSGVFKATPEGDEGLARFLQTAGLSKA